MYLKRLEIQGFKSFAHRITMEFGPGITAIVGPNGSGKSNVADALRWVLGEQSAKIIRGKKADDVIFAGSEKKSRLGFCEVVAIFDNADRHIPLDMAEVSIGRRVDRSGSSEYLLNGAQVRLLDIIDLVLKSNIGTSRYTVIGQGTIDQMILAGPQEVKNLLDEASGVKIYNIRRDKTLRRLDQTAQNLIRAEDLIAEIAPRLRSLRRQAKKMEERAAVEQELKIYQREYFGKAFWNLKEFLDKHASQIQILDERKFAVEREVFEQTEKAEKEELAKNNIFGKFRQIQEELGKLQSIKNKLLEDLSMVRGKMQSQKSSGTADAKTLQLEAHHAQSALLDVEEKIKELSNSESKQVSELEKNREALLELNKRLDKLYEFLQNPNTIDWQGFKRELAILEDSLNVFFGNVSAGQPWQQVKISIDSLKNTFSQFKIFVNKSFRDPNAAANLQAELKKVLREKEELNGQIQELELILSKNKISLEFLLKEKHKLLQEKLRLDLEMKNANSLNMDDFLRQLIEEENKIQKEIENQSTHINKLEELFKSEQVEQEKKQRHLHETESLLRKKQEELLKIKDEISKIQIEKAKTDTQNEVLREEILRMLGEEEYKNIQEEKNTGNIPDLENKILKLQAQLNTIGGIDELTLQEYKETENRYQTLGGQIQDLKKSMQDLRQILDELDEQIKIKFNLAFYRINEKFEHYFRILFNGGRAFLSLIKARDEKQMSADESNMEEPVPSSVKVLEDLRPEEKIVQKYQKGGSNIIGIDIKATPAGKKLAHIQALSGGERSLTSIALLCSLLTCFPSPFVVLDEVDAALDDANTIRFAQIINSLAKTTQFVTITHNRETMAHANILYGVTMGDDGVSKLLSVKLEQAKAYVK